MVKRGGLLPRANLMSTKKISRERIDVSIRHSLGFNHFRSMPLSCDRYEGIAFPLLLPGCGKTRLLRHTSRFAHGPSRIKIARILLERILANGRAPPALPISGKLSLSL